MNRSAVLTVLVIAAFNLADVRAASGSLPDRPLPPEFQAYHDPQGTGRILIDKHPGGSRSARVAMRDALVALKGYFDAPPQLGAAVDDGRDGVVQIMLTAQLQTQSVRGVATMVVGQSGTTFGLIYDRPDALRDSYQRLSRKLGELMPRSTARSGALDLRPPQSWARQTAGDRSAAVNLPPGWRITSVNQGAVEIIGPNKELIEFGLTFFVQAHPLPGSQGMVSPYLKPEQAFSMYVEYFNRLARAQGSTATTQLGRLLGSTPAPWPAGQGAYMVREARYMGRDYKILALVLTAPLLMDSWQLYTSYVVAPADHFASELPDLLRIWTSWKIDDHVFQQRMQQTLELMNETRDILRSGQERAMHAYDNLNESFDLIIKGEDRLENTASGQRADVFTQDTDGILRQCKALGQSCRRVPIDQLVGP